MAIIDGSNEQYPKIKIKHVPTGQSVEFLPYITDFSDNFASKWEETEAFGRMDNIKTFSRTTRTISLTFNIISENLSEAKINYSNTSKLMSFLYPTYREKPINIQQDSSVAGETSAQDNNNPVARDKNEAAVGAILSSQTGGTAINNANNTKNSSLLNAPPILQIDFSNLIKNETNQGLYGTVEGLVYKPDTEAGYFIDGNKKKMYAKVVEISFSFTVIHSKPLGWRYNSETNDFELRNKNFPFFDG